MPAASRLLSGVCSLLLLTPAAGAGSTDAGAELFARACAACHGSTGRGDGPAAADLDPRPRDLTTRRFRFRTTESGESPRPEDLERTIRSGLPGTAMPAFGELFSAEEIADLIRHVAALGPDGGREPPPPVDLPDVGRPGPGTAEEGRAIYLLSGCWRCHGVNGDGRGPSAGGLTDENDRPIRTTDFRYDPFKGGRDAASVVRTLFTGLNGAPMPSYGEAMLFAREDVGDTSAWPDTLTDVERAGLETQLRSLPTRSRLDELGEAGRAELRDRRLAALAHYVLSLDRRQGFLYRVFREQPEREGRAP